MFLYHLKKLIDPLSCQYALVPIPGTRNVVHLTENLGALNVDLMPTDLSEIETAMAKIKVHGGRMNEMQMKMVLFNCKY